MDLRTERTKKNIVNAFIELRSQKPLEKITVKELAEKAYINKATFYLHYKDIYDLSEQLENEVIDGILSNIPYPEELISQPKKTTETLVMAFLSQSRLVEILFSGNRMAVLAAKFEKEVKQRIYEVCPECKDDMEKDIILTYLIQGGFTVFMSQSGDPDFMQKVEIAGRLSEKMLS